MGIYIFILIIIVFFSTLIIITKLRNKGKITTIIVGFLLFLISAIRGLTVGTDLPRYIRRFYIIGETDWSSMTSLNDRWGFEYGYLYLNKLLYLIAQNERLLIIFTSALVIGSFCYFIYKNSKIPWLSFYLLVTLYFYGTSFNLIRMFIAISICLISIEFIKKNKPLKFFFFVVIASLFHTTALAFLLLYPVSRISINKKYLIFISGLFIVIMLLKSHIISFLLPLFGYEHYSTDLGSGDGNGMLMLLIFILFSIFVLKKTNLFMNINLNIWLHMVIIAVGFNVLSLELWIAARVMWYFKVALLILIPNTIVSIKATKIRFIIYIFVLSLPLIYFYLVANQDNAGIIPYLFMWE